MRSRARIVRDNLRVDAFFVGVAASAVVLLGVWALYPLVYRAEARKRATAACWWLPIWRSFRLVVRNMDGKDPVTAVRYRIWLRQAKPAIAGSSVITWLDRDLAESERILLPRREDL